MMNEAETKRLLTGGGLQDQKKHPGLLALCGKPSSKSTPSHPKLARVAMRSLCLLKDLMDKEVGVDFTNTH